MSLNTARLLLVAIVVTAECVLSAYCSLPASAASTSGATPMAGMANMANMPHASATPTVEQLAATPDTAPASPVSGIDWSIFNHRGAGWFVFMWGLTALLAGLQWPRRTWIRFVPPLALLGLAEFLFLRNDPKAWPIGPIGFWVSMQDPAVVQHRVFVVLIALIAVVELLRAADRLPPLLQKFALPALALFGGILLFFHKHGGLHMQQMMQQSDQSMRSNPEMKSMLTSMRVVKHEHLWISIFGFGFAVTRLLADTGTLKGRLGATLWPIFAMALGVYLFGYTE
jgi:putative copper resistance protein D